MEGGHWRCASGPFYVEEGVEAWYASTGMRRGQGGRPAGGVPRVHASSRAEEGRGEGEGGREGEGGGKGKAGGRGRRGRQGALCFGGV